ncbi:MAG: bifunctional UDP-N-acetylmuramoyl-tripeptide:D-alanyl-D-alanine ligase/alanine racemase [Cytophagales bacterium]|nr:MAG: bifunctional UDP-N-acetylmuramoyl-tripeptide:D-alanyl-D-alanine ligase/alanine racemase [Cytophagales bacterium]
MLKFSQIINCIQGEILQIFLDEEINNLIFDSRKIPTAQHSVFFAIDGDRHNGHQFIESAYNKGVRNFIIEKKINISQLPEANIILTNSSVKALQNIAKFHREKFKIPVIGITGSNGKTIVKEWLAQLLSKEFNLIKSPRSFNSQIGVPLSVWNMQANHNLGIFEAGISKPNEMGNLEKIIQPSIGIFTNIGTAHDEGFENTAQKIREKLLLFSNCEVLIFCSDYESINNEIATKTWTLKTFSWSIKSNIADVKINIKQVANNSSIIELNHNNDKTSYIVPFTDNASIENIIHCIVLMIYLKIPAIDINQRLKGIQSVAMRLELKQGINNCYIIDDSYNNDLEGLSNAINFLEQQNASLPKTIIISDLLESSISSDTLYARVAELIKSKNIHLIAGIGKDIQILKSEFTNSAFYPTTEDFLNNFQTHKINNQIVLIKGARKFQFEKLAQLLQEKAHGTVLEVNLDAITHNLNYFKSQLNNPTKIMVMVKAFAYGSGSYEVANLLQFHHVDYLGVAYADEGVELRNHGIQIPIMVMNPSSSAFFKIIDNNLEPEIYNFRILHQFIDFIKHAQIPQARIHLKIDTGMHRLGFEEHEISDLIKILKDTPELKVISLFSHLAGADSKKHNGFTIVQLNLFSKIASIIESELKYIIIKHILNSAGIINYPEHQFDMVRLGIGLYGIDASENVQSKLATVGRLKTIISQIKHVASGETIGYSRVGVANSPTTIATIAIGYADGYNRGFSNGIGKVVVNGQLCPVIGNVCMDMTMIDITNIEANEGDEVEIFGENNSIQNLANSINTIPYEILTNVSERVKRIFYSEQ